jgi:hypothetical protein
MLSIGVPPMMVFTLRIGELAAWAGTDNDVSASSSRLFRQSTKRPKWERKSTPNDGVCDIGQHEPPLEIPAYT